MTRAYGNLSRWTLCMLCVLGATISAVLVRAHAGPWPGTDGPSGVLSHLCGGQPGAESGCATVIQSDWSAFDITIPVITSSLSITRQRIVIPVAFAGLAYFVAMGVWFSFAGHPETWGRWRALPVIAVVAGALGSAVLIGVLVTRLDSRCTLCLATHAINGVLAIGTLLTCRRRRTESSTPDASARRTVVEGTNLPTLTPTAVFRIAGFATVVIVGLWMYRGAKMETRKQVVKLLPYRAFVEQRTNDSAFLVREFYAQPQQEIEIASPCEDVAFADDIPTLTIFTDFQCSACACFASKWQSEYASNWQGAIRIDVRHYPLSAECNDSVATDLHPEACGASYAAEAARLQGGEAAFTEMHDRLFASMGRLDGEPFGMLASGIGLNSDQLLADMNQPAVQQAVAHDVALGEQLGIAETPAVFLNGRRVPSYCLHNTLFWEAVSADLQRAPSAEAEDTRLSRLTAPAP